MSTTIVVQVTEQGIFIPRDALAGWGEVEMVETEEYIIVRPQTPTPGQIRALAIQALREDGLLYKLEGEADLPIVSEEERAQLGQRLGEGRPLSDIVTEEREDRV